jgi:D-sedoheptulose 7-phosphate isomerase
MIFFNEYIDAINSINDKEYKNFSNQYNHSKKIVLLGNGGSNAAASHIAQDMTKRGGKVAMSFTDPSMLTCFTNDYGQDLAYMKYLEFYADRDTFVILISSSGNSENLVNCVKWCESNGILYGILTAFDKENRMRKFALNPVFKYHINTDSYGVAECVHQIFLHGIVECSE